MVESSRDQGKEAHRTQHRYFDTFTGTTGTNLGATTAQVNTAGGWVTAPTTYTPLWSDTFSDAAATNAALTTASVNTATGLVELNGTPPTWSTLGSDSFASTTGVDLATTVRVDTGSGTAQLNQEPFTLGSDTFTNTANTVAGTTATWNAAGQSMQLGTTVTPTAVGTDNLSDTSHIASSTSVVVSGGTATLAKTAWIPEASETFTSAAQVDMAASTNIQVDTATGQVLLRGSDTLDAKVVGTQTGGAVLSGPSGNGQWNSFGMSYSDVVYSGGAYHMWFSTGKAANNTPTIGYATSADGVNWTQQQASLAGGPGSLTAETAIAVYQIGSTYFMGYANSSGSSVVVRGSTDGVNWSAESNLVGTMPGGVSVTGRVSVVQDASGTYRMVAETNNGTLRQWSSTNGTTWTDNNTWSLAGYDPELVRETDASGNPVYSLYSQTAVGGTMVKRSSSDLLNWSAAIQVITAAGGSAAVTFDDNAIRTGGVVFDGATGLSRMLYTGKPTAGGDWAAGLAYVKAYNGGTYQGQVITTTDSLTTIRLNATATTPAGTGITYQVSSDGGSTWLSVTPGGTYTLATPGKNLVVRATLSNSAASTQPTVSPALQDWSVDLLGYTSPGEIISTAYSAGGRTISNITLNAAQTTPAGTGIQYSISTDGTTWQAIAAGVNTALATPGSSVYVRVVLSSSDYGQTPVLDSYSLATDFTDYVSGQRVVSRDWTFTDAVDRVQLNVAENKPAGTGITYEVSINGGTSWQAVTPGSYVNLGSSTTQIRLRATMTTTDPTRTPELLDYSFEGQRYATGQELVSSNYTFAEAVGTIRLAQNATTPAGTGIQWYYSTNNGTSWAAFNPATDVALGTPTTQVKLRAVFSTANGYHTPTLSDYTLTGRTLGFTSPQVFQSTTHSYGYNVQNVRLNVTENEPAGTSIGYELSTNGGTTWQAIAPGALTAVTPGSQLVMRATLNGTTALSPQLLDYSLETNVRQDNTVWQSTTTATAATVSSVRLTSTETLNGGSVAYQVSADGGASWAAVTPGATVALGTPGTQLVVRATLGLGADPNLAPQLQDVRLETYDYAASQSFQSSFQALVSPVTEVRLDSVTATTPGGTGIQYFVTNDGGTTWQSVSAGSTATFASAGSQVGFRAVMTSTGAATPHLQDFTLSVPGYSGNRYLYSTVQTTAQPITNVTLSANDLTPAGTSIQYQISADGGGSWQTVTPGANVALTTPGNQLVMRALLNTSDPSATPEILDYRIDTNVNTSGRQVVSQVYTTGATTRAVRLDVTEEKPAGTGITYEVSADGGSSWTAVAPGAVVNLTTPGTQLVMRATLTSTDPQHQIAPRLLDYQLSTYDYATSQQFVSVMQPLATPTNQVQLNVSQSVAAGTGLAYQVSVNNGATWDTVTPGVLTTLSHSGTQLVVRALLTGDGSATPELLDYTVQVPGYVSGRYLQSSVQSFATAVDSVTLNVSESTPSGTGITYEVSTNNGGSWTAITPGTNTVVPAGTQLVMRALLTSSAANLTPELLDYSLSTNAPNSGRTWQSAVANTGSTVGAVRLTTTQNTPAGTSIAYQVSGDGGVSWTAVTPGSTVALGTPGSQLVLRTTLSSSDPHHLLAPELLDYRLETFDYQSGQQVYSTVTTLANATNQVRLDATANLPAGTGIAYHVSADGGTTWDAVAPGVLSTLSHSGTQLMARATLTGTNTAAPELLDWSLEVPGYTSGRYVYSTVQNYATAVSNLTLNVTEERPAGTGITYAVSTDGGLAWQAVTPGTTVALTTPGTQLVMRALLSTTDPNLTPRLLDYAMETNVDTSGRQLVTSPIVLGSTATAVRLTTTEDRPAGTGITYEVSADGGVSWTAVTPGATVALGTPGSQLVMRATFTSSDPQHITAPRLLDYQLETYDYANSQQWVSTTQTLANATDQVRLNVSQSVPAGTGIAYEVSLNGGTTWEAVTPGVLSTLGHTGNQLKVRALMTGNGSTTPQLLDYSVEVPGYVSPRVLQSTVHNYASAVTNLTLDVNDTTPAGTGISYQISTNGGTTWQAITPGVNTLVTPGTQVALRATFTSTDPNATPRLLDYTLRTNADTSGTQWTSTVTNTGTAVNQVRFTPVESLAAGTAIGYQISTDGGLSWAAIAPGAWTNVTPGPQLAVRALFSSTNPDHAVSARLLSYTLESRDYATDQTFYTVTKSLSLPTDQIKLSANANLPAGTSIDYEVSVDGGASWLAVTPGNTATFATPGANLVMRARLRGTNSATPELLDYRLEGVGFASGKVVESTVQALWPPPWQAPSSRSTPTRPRAPASSTRSAPTAAPTGSPLARARRRR